MPVTAELELALALTNPVLARRWVHRQQIAHHPSDLAELGSSEHLAVVARSRLGRADAEQALRGAIDCRQEPVPVERDNPGVDVREQDFHGAAPRFEFLMALLQFRSHTVKGRNQGPDFVFPLSLDAVGPVALGDLPRAGGELLEGHGDFFC